MNTSFSKYKYPLIGVLVLSIFLLILKFCSRPKPTPGPVSKTSFYHAIDIPLFAQNGEKSCWAATISMLDSIENYPLNAHNTLPIWSDSLVILLNDTIRKIPLQRIALKKSSELSWDKFKNTLEQNKPMVAYKYFNVSQNHKNAHVFVVKGFQEINNSKWVIVNDPWPVGIGKISAVALNNFSRPKLDAINYTNIAYNYTSNDQDVKTEQDFTIFSAQDISTQNPTVYLPDLERVNLGKNKLIKPKNVAKLLSRQLVLLQQSNPELFKKLRIDYRPTIDKLSIDLKSFLNVREFATVAQFLNYNLEASQDKDYLFDGEHLVFVNANKNNEPDMSITIQLEDRANEPFLYVSRFESYNYSFKKDWDHILNDVGIALTNPGIRNFLFNLSQVATKNVKELLFYNSPSLAKFQKAGFDFGTEEETFSQGEPFDVAMIPLYGGPVYSFTLKGYDEKIVADPYNQLNFRNDRKTLFIGASGTPYYRLSSILIPTTYEFVNKERPKEEEWRLSEKPNNPEASDRSRPSGDSIVSSIPNEPIEGTRPYLDISTPSIVLDKIFAPRGVLRVLDYEANYDGKNISIAIDPIAMETIGETKIKSILKEILQTTGEGIYGNDEETKRRLKLAISSTPIVLRVSKEKPALEQAKQKVNRLLDRLGTVKDPK